MDVILVTGLAIAFAGTLAASPEHAPASVPFQQRTSAEPRTLFSLVPAEQTGIAAMNKYDEAFEWGDKFVEFNNGSLGTGIAIGDIDNDGRPDVVVSNKNSPCRLYRNLGDFHFEDVTERAGLMDGQEAGLAEGLLAAFKSGSDSQGQRWNEGVALVDVNNDGFLDIYICRYNAPNLLYINQRDGTFKEEAKARGLAVIDSSVMASFCDYDRDGWLDVLIQTNLLDATSQPKGRPNHLLHNKGDGYFEEVSDLLRPNPEAQGHSCFWWDFDGDGWPDLYIANDFDAPDLLYHNLKGKRFEEISAALLPHTPFSSMGCDVADVDGDGLIDLFVADMEERSHEKDQRTLAPSRYSQKRLAPNYARQISRNALFLPNRSGRVREGAYLAGLAATDWTWSPRFEDFDDDGRVDLFVTTGMNREHHNLDLLARTGDAGSVAEEKTLLKSSAVFHEKNLAFRNNGNMSFTEVGQTWGLDDDGVSFGAATGDLDGDGRMDIVVSNYNRAPSVYRNNNTAGHRIIFSLAGHKSNRFGIGALVKIQTASGTQVSGLWSARGYQSTSEPIVHFGLGAEANVERVEVHWPSGLINTWTNLSADRKYVLEEREETSAEEIESTQFEKVSGLSTVRTESFEQPESKEVYRLAPWRIDANERLTAESLRPIIHDTGSSLESECPELVENPGATVETIAVSSLAPGGDPVIFVGRRSLLGHYPKPAECSLLLKNNGVWRDETERLAPILKTLGNVRAAIWTDVDNDGFQDLIVAPEWDTVHCFHNDGGRALVDVSERLGFDKAGKGWWRSIASGDFNGDGRIDYIVGNVGFNTQYTASEPHPARLYYRPGNTDGKQLIEAYYEGETLFPWRSRNDLVSLFPAIGRRLRSNNAYAKATLQEVLGSGFSSFAHVDATNLGSGVFLSQPDGTYRFAYLPREAQIAPAQAMVVADFNGDGCADVYIAQNSREPKSPPWDGGVGQLLLGDPSGGFSVASPHGSGLVVGGAATGVAVFDANNDGWADLAVAQANDAPVVFQNRGLPGRSSFAVNISQSGRIENYAGARIEVEGLQGRRQIAEVCSHPGGMVRNQPAFFFGRSIGESVTVAIRWPDGHKTVYHVPATTQVLAVAKN